MFFAPFTSPLYILANIIELVILVIIIQAIVSWAGVFGARGVTPRTPWVRSLNRITDPIMAPVRRLLPRGGVGGLDVAPLITVVILQVIQRLLYMMAR